MLYILATSFYLPPQAFQYLQSSIELYMTSQNLTTDIYLLADARFNLARAILDLVEMAEDVGDEGSVLGDKGAAGWRAEAFELLKSVGQVQANFLQSGADDSNEPQQTESSKADNDGEGGVADEDGDEDSVYEQQLPTQESLLDTLLMMIDVRTAAAAAGNVVPQNERLEIGTLLDQARNACEQMTDAQQRASAELRWLIASVEAKRAAGDTGTPDDATKLSGLLTSATDEDVRNEGLTTLLDLQAAQAGQSVPDIAWRILSQATKTGTDYLAASAGSTPSIQMGGAVLTPRALFRASLYNTLSTLALRRGLLSDAGLETATKNLKALLVNAETYARKALEELQWNSIATAASGAITMPAPAGWSAECVGRTAIFALLRALFYLSEAAVPADVAAAAKTRLQVLLDRVRTIPRPVTPQDLERFIDDVSTDEGPLRSQEMAFWKRLAG